MFKNTQLWKIALLGTGAFLVLNPRVIAAEMSGIVNPSPTANFESNIGEINLPAEPVLIAQNFCGEQGLKVENYFETENFIIHICYDNNNDLWYYGIEKGPRSSYIVLPAYTEEGTGYVAENGDYTYIVNGAALSIYEGNTLIQEDPVIAGY